MWTRPSTRACGHWNEASELACKPGSVHAPGGACGDHPSGADVAADLMRSTRRLGRAALERLRSISRSRRLLTLLQVGFTKPPQSPTTLVVSYTTVSPLPSGEPDGGLLSVALSRGSPRVGVAHHLALWSPDFPRPMVSHRPRPPGQLARDSRVATFLPPHAP